jgi:hypothetical protein
MGQAFRPDLIAIASAPENMAAWVMRYAPATDSEALKLLRSRFPESPLSLRVAALAFLMRRRNATLAGRRAGE